MTTADSDRIADARAIAVAAREASVLLAQATREKKDAALKAMARQLDERRSEILAVNEADMSDAEAAGLSANMVDRLKFGEKKIDSRIDSLSKIIALEDPVGKIFREETRPGGLIAGRMRVPLGVVLMVYEARPHVTVNAGALCLKSSNAAILRGGSEAKRCNALLGEMWRRSLEEAHLPAQAVQVISGPHEQIDELIRQEDCIDLVIPRGGKKLIESVSAKSRVPVLKHSAGICHVYVDDSADQTQAINIVVDSKCLMPEVCNAMETILVSAGATDQLPGIVAALRQRGVEVKGCDRTREVVADVADATEEDWATEYLDMVVSIRVVDGVDAAAEHINRYGSHHTDSIVTHDKPAAETFVRSVDSAVVLVNASTMFCDGASLGMGAEIGISTDKIHARGPMGMEELTSYKFVIRGYGHVMGPADREVS